MKHQVPAFLILLLASGCGKVGEPRPPKIRTPAKIADLKVSQNLTDVVLSWTNPQKYVDGSNATDLNSIQILENGKPVAIVPVSGPGLQQSYALHGSADFGTTSFYSIVVKTQRGKFSEVSNLASIAVVDVPGVVLNLKGHMDQHRILLDWEAPVQNPSFADIYVVRREDGAIPPAPVTETHWEDRSVEAGKTYSYVVTATRNSVPPVSGQPSSPYKVDAIDKTEPSPPTGLQPPIVSDLGAVLTWDKSSEEDWAGYNVYRSDSADTEGVLLNDALLKVAQFRDGAYRPGSYYRVSAVDESGNKSRKTEPVHAP